MLVNVYPDSPPTLGYMAYLAAFMGDLSPTEGTKQALVHPYIRPYQALNLDPEHLTLSEP